MRLWLAVLTSAATLACQPARPSLGEWQKGWTEIQAAVPSEGEAEACEGLLVATRSSRDRLLPSPEAALDPAITDWLTEADRAATECSNFDLLRGLAAEVNAAIASGLVR